MEHPPHITKAPKGRHEMESTVIIDGTTSPWAHPLLHFRARAQSAVADGTRHRNRKTLRGGSLDIFEFEHEHEHEILSSTKARRQVDSLFSSLRILPPERRFEGDRRRHHR